MISAIKLIGEQASSAGTITDDMYSNIKLGKKENFIATVDFSTNNKVIHITLEPIDKQSIKELSKEYLWVGNLKANTPQWHATTDNLSYLFEAVPRLYKNNFKKLKQIVENYYYDDKINFEDVSIEIYSKKYNTNIKFTKVASNKKEYRRELIDQLKKQTSDLNGFYSNIKLYTISIDGNLIVDDNEYKEILLNSLSLDDLIYNDGICFICGKKTKVTSDTKKLSYKYYNTDKHSFASNIKDFSKNFQMCKDCYNSIISGENFIKNNLATYLGYNILVIPEEIPFVQKNIDIKVDIKEAFKLVNSAINNNIDSIIKLENNALSITGPDEYFLNIIFYIPNNSSFKIIDMITEIPVSRIKEIDGALVRTYNNYSDLLQSNKYFNIGDFRKMVTLYTKESISMVKRIFTATPIQKAELIKRFNKYNSSNFFNSGKSKFVYKDILKQNAYIKFLGEIKSIKEEKNMENEEFEEKMGYSNVEEALFNMGFAMGEIGKYLYASKEIGKNPLLDKINFQGMNFRSIFRFGNAIDEKIQQYDIHSKKLPDSLKIFHEVLSRYIVNKEKWPLSDDENVFLIMTGYSLSRAKNNEEEIK